MLVMVVVLDEAEEVEEDLLVIDGVEVVEELVLDVIADEEELLDKAEVVELVLLEKVVLLDER